MQRIALVLLMTLVLVATSCCPRVAWAGSVLGAVSGTIRDALPMPGAHERLPAIYPQPGTAAVSISDYCGDGDVASFARANPEVDFFEGGDHPTAPVILGYWVTPHAPAAGDYPVPNAANWFPIATGAVPTDGRAVAALAPTASGGAATQSIGRLVAESLGALGASPGHAMAAGGVSQFDVHVGLFACRRLRDGAGTGPPSAPATVAAEFSSAVPATIDAAVASALGQATPLAYLNRFDVGLAGADASRVALTFGRGPLAVDDVFSRAAARVLELDVNRAASLEAQDGALRTELSAIASDLARSTTCARVHGVTQTKARWWEPYDLQLTCAMLDGALPSAVLALPAFRDALDTFYRSDRAGFATNRLRLAALLLRASLMQAVAGAVDDRFAASRPRVTCIDYQKRYIDSIMSSLPLPVGFPRGAPENVTLKVTSPEGDFAGAGHLKYWSRPQGDFTTIFGMGGTVSPHVLTLGRATPPGVSALVMQSSYRASLSVRAIHCQNGIFFCRR